MRVDPTDPSEPIHLILDNLPPRERLLRKIAVYRLYCGNQPEYVDFLIEVIGDAPDRRQGFVPARIAISSINIAAGTEFHLPRDLRQEMGVVAGSAEGRTEHGAKEVATSVHAQVLEWWAKKRSSWCAFCRGRDVSGTVYDPPTFVDARIWNEALVPNERLPLPPETPTDTPP